MGQIPSSAVLNRPALVVGYGSIGQRHTKILQSLGCSVAVVSRRPQTQDFPVFSTIAEAIEQHKPAYVVVASATAEHAQDLETLSKAGFKGEVLVEKPLYQHRPLKKAAYPFNVHVGYQLRLHPVVVALKKALEGKKVYSAHAYVGQHLSQWRPGRAPESSYSAHKSAGGGVLRDLSHELDLVHYLFGKATSMGGVCTRVSGVTVDAEDLVALVLKTEKCPAITLQLNYLDQAPCRNMRVVTDAGTLVADLIKGELSNGEDVRTFEIDRNNCYKGMHEAVLTHTAGQVCSLEDGEATVKLIEDIERGTQ